MPDPSAVARTICVPEDSKTIQAAIDAAEAGDTILVSAGRYAERVRLKENIALRSAGDNEQGKLGLKRAEVTIIDGGGNEGGEPGVLMADGATFDGFTVTGVGRYDDAEWTRHHKTQGEQQSHEHIGQFGSPAVGIVGANCTVINNIVHHNGDTGIGIRGVEERKCAPRVSRNVCYRNMGGGIGSMQGSTALIDSNTCFQNFYAGIGHDDASPIVIGNECYENIRAGIGISHGASPVVRGNRCYRNRRAGIGTRTGNSTRPVIENNDCFENDMAGIGCEEQAAPIIRGNRCHHNRMAGIGSRTGASPVIVANECFENDLAGIGNDGVARSVVIDNVSRENKAAGIGIRGKDSHAVLCGNKCLENRLVAIGIPDGATAVLVDNQLRRTGGQPPLVAVRGGSSAVCWKNSFTGGGVAGLLLQGTALISDNDFLGCGEGQSSAIWIWKDSNATVERSRFTDYRDAVNASGARVRVVGNLVHGFSKTAIRIQADEPAVVVDNTAYSDDESATPATVSDGGSVVHGNRRLRSTDPNSSDEGK